MLRLSLSVVSLLIYGIAFVRLFPEIGANVGALTFLPVVAIGWFYGFWMGLAGAIGISVVNAFVYPTLDSPLAWVIPLLSSLFMGAFVGYASDLRKQLDKRQRALAALAESDQLTGLLNRPSFHGALAEMLLRRGPHAVMYMDLDGFKTINDTFGHRAGDRLLEQVADRLSAIVRGTDALARIGGDEFVIAVADLASPEEAAALAERIIDTMRTPLHVAGVPMSASLSVGIAMAPDDGATAEDLLHAADQAMYGAKRSRENGSRGYCFHHDVRDVPSEHRMTPLALQHALREHEFKLVYQPQVHLPSGAVTGFEALVRWEHPDLGLLSPAAFLPMAEETKLIVPLGEWALREACRQAVVWQEHGGDRLTVSVNASAAQVAGPAFVDTVSEALRESGLRPGQLELEVTETLLIREFERVAETLEALASLGVRIAVDDFGAGYSSLTYLHRLPFHTLKIDRSFLLDSLGPTNGAARAGLVIRSMIRLAHDLGMTVVAEGVETAAQADFLASAGSDYAQGYFFAKPLPAEDACAWMENLELGRRDGARHPSPDSSPR